MRDLSSRLAGRIQLTTDGLAAYGEAVHLSFGDHIDFAQLVKEYGDSSASTDTNHRYSPGTCTGTHVTVQSGEPDGDLISTSYAERENLTHRMQSRRFTRFTNGFSKKVENHAHSVALYVFFYNYCRVHQTLRVSPAMAAGITDHLWEVPDMVALLNAQSATVPVAA